MDETTIEPEVEELEETPEAELTPDTDWEAEAKKARGIAQRALTKLKKIGESQPAKVEPTDEPVKQTQNPDGLDEKTLDYLDLKGITADEDVKVIEDIIKKTGQTVREVLKDDYVISKLDANKAKRATLDATPSNTRRAGAGSANDLALAMAKYEQTRELPTDFELRSAVINAMEQKTTSNKPSWL